ncbi:hypothetical protein BC939DRAFT_466313 [Gamsiella multidivaricata]|uniref:uncharacterized protein n=1 Tax=Gamsiella multidivaricata TaxID=101098 RepID=UPI002220D902|nr:uncharacterized protein BC939DRAFT_466313 [Gamsiella multidivaricata]KAG0368217.1 Ethanolamine-phosphate cytidylyltransferase [Gamsiella multidivaricata]KAI7817313.1 hypothetical protein BC939DRAFT_466313 [Gamsiella multidivaricata]
MTAATADNLVDHHAPRKPVRVWVDGCFDVMHYGHYNALRQAKAMGDSIVAGVHSDAELLLHKGPPVMNEQERIATAAACKWVDEVVPNAPYLTSLEWMDQYNCDFCVHGDDISTLADGSDSYKHVKDVGRYRECKRTKGVSTTDLVARMLLMKQDAPDNVVPEDGTCHSDVDVGVDGDRNADACHVLATARKIVQFASGNREPKKGSRIVYVDGTFDLFHVGHIEFLKRARATGDYLVVGVHDDQTIRAIKGPNHPLLSMHERVLSVLSCRYVDDVVIGAPYAVTDQILDGDYPVDVVMHGSTPTSNNLLGQDPYKVAKERGIFVQLEGPPHPVTTGSIVQRILINRTLYEERQKRKTAKEAAAVIAHSKEE